jgi:hypothetical protein
MSDWQSKITNYPLFFYKGSCCTVTHSIGLSLNQISDVLRKMFKLPDKFRVTVLRIQDTIPKSESILKEEKYGTILSIPNGETLYLEGINMVVNENYIFSEFDVMVTLEDNIAYGQDLADTK